MTPSHLKSLEKSAALLGYTVEEMSLQVRNEWEALGHMTPGWVPAGWREARLLYELSIDADGHFVDLTTAESLATLNRELGEVCEADYEEFPITLGTLTGENREVTTAIATWVRDQVLDDGSYPLGIRFHTKHGGGVCWAYWLRRTDDKLGPDFISVKSEFEITLRDPAYKAVLKDFGIQSR